MKRTLLAIIFCVFLQMTVNGQTFTYTPASGSFTVPAAAGLSVKVQAWGGGGAGGGSTNTGLGLARGGAGGGGGAYAESTFIVSSGVSLNIAVAGLTTGSSGANGNDGFDSTVIGFVSDVKAFGGKGGKGNTSGGTPVGGAGGTFIGTIGNNGLSGSDGATGLLISSGAGGAGSGVGGGAGGTAINSSVLANSSGNAGANLGGGGGGAVTTFFGGNQTGGTGAAGKVVIDYTCPNYNSLSSPATGTNACVSSGSSTITLTSATGLPVGTYVVTYNTSLPVQTGLTAMMTVTVAGTGTFIATGLTTVGNSDITVTKLTSGPCFTDITTNGIATVTVNEIPAAPTLNQKTMGCLDTSFVADWTAIANATGYRLDVAYDADFTIFVPGYQDKPLGNVTSDSVIGLTANGVYYVRLRALNSCGTSVSSSLITVSVPTTTYNGTWSNGVPNSNMNIIFTANYSSTGNLSGCSCQVNSGNVVINSGHTLAITNAVTVSGGTLTFEDDASLVQINDVVNSGNITYKRETTTISKSDYTYWSSPVSPQKLYDVSPNTLSGKFYSFDAAIDNWKQENSQNLMTKGIGYIIAGPQDYGTTSPPVPPSVYEANFIGVPNNGTFSLNSISADKWYLIGNPYPSALDANAFLDANNTVLDGTIYFWTHNTAIQLASNITNGTAGSGVYAYTSDDYATYNRVGGVGTAAAAPGENSNAPSGKIGAGQSFFASTKSGIPSSQIVFNNAMRVGVGGITGDNSQFFRMNTSSKMTDVTEKNRVWLNLTNTQGAFKQTLVGYVTGATNGYEGAFDGESFDGNDYVDFYSIDQDKNLTIQGRALPFDVTDAVPLGYKTTIAGTFSIGIDHVDGLLASQDVLLEDKVTQTVQNLKEGPYSFTTATGSFNDRFVLRYANKTLGAADFKTLENSVLVSTKNKQITINSSVETIDKIQVYDVLGRQIYKKLNVDTTEFSIPNLVIEEQVLIVKVILKNDNTVTNKIILK